MLAHCLASQLSQGHRALLRRLSEEDSGAHLTTLWRQQVARVSEAAQEPSKRTQTSPLLVISLDSQPAREASGAAAPQGRTAPGSYHGAVSSQVSTCLCRLHALKRTWHSGLKQPSLPATPSFLGAPGLVKGQLADQGTGTQCVRSQQPHCIAWDERQNQRRTSGGEGADSSEPLTLQASKPAVIQASGHQLGAGPHRSPTNCASWHHCPDRSRPRFPRV